MAVDPETPGARPTFWIAMAVICAVAAVGLGVWAVTTKSDLDDANDKLDKQEQQLAAQEKTAATTEASERAFGADEVARYRRVRRRLIRAQREEGDLNARIKTERAQLRQAQTELANADTVDERREAELKVLREQHDVAAACARGAVASINDIVDATTATAGARAALKKLESMSPDCQDVLR
jgi:chromosome segregation ATPase